MKTTTTIIDEHQQAPVASHDVAVSRHLHSNASINQSATALTLDVPVEGDISTSGEQDAYQFTLVAGETYIFTLTSSGTNPLTDPLLYISLGNLILSDNDSGSGNSASIVFTATSSTTNFSVSAAGFSGAQGHYTLTASTGGPVDSIPGESFGPGATLGTVTYGQTTTSTLSAVRDVDWFSVDLTAGNVYQLTFAGQAVDGLAALESGEATLYLFDSVYNTFRSVTGVRTDDEGSAKTFFEVTTSGTYYIAVGVNPYAKTDANYGGYAVTIGPDTNDIDANGPASATIGKDVSSTLTGYETDTFTYHLVAGQVYDFYLDSGAYTNNTMTIGTVTTADNGYAGPGHLGFNPATTGDYNLVVGGSYPSDYTLHSDLRPADLAGNATTTAHLKMGEVTRGYADMPRDVDWYAVDLTAGQTYFFNIKPQFEPNATFGLQLVRGDGTVVAGGVGTLTGYEINDVQSAFAFTATTSGTYYVYAKDWWGYADDSTYFGNYTIQAERNPDVVGQTAGTAVSLSVGQIVSGTIDTNTDEDWYGMQVTAGYTYSVASTAPISLVGGAYTHLESNTFGMQFTATATGTIYISAGQPASQFNVPQYTVLHQDYSLQATLLDTIAGDPTTTGTLDLGQAVSGTIDFTSGPGTAGDTDWYAIHLEAGKAYTFSATDTAADPGIWGHFDVNVYDASGNPLVSAPGPNDDSISYYAATSGLYFVGIGHYYARPYSLRADYNTDVFGNSSTYSVLDIGGTAHSSIDKNFDEDWFRVELVAGQSYEFSVTPEGGQPLDSALVRVISGVNGVRAIGDDGPGAHDAVVRFTPTVSGTYFISASSQNNQTGAYAVSAVAVAPQDPVAAITGTGVPVDHNISVYFAAQNQVFDGHTATVGWSDLEIQGFLTAGTAWSNVANVTFTQTTSAASADLVLVYGDIPLAAEMTSSKVVVVDDAATDALQYYLRYLQASGLALGLVQPDWHAGHEPLQVFPPSDPSLYLPFGTFSLGNHIYTVMSTNPLGWYDSGFYAGSPTGPGALDIAAVQARYGASAVNAGDTVYSITNNTAGFSVIWDSGGTDTIQDTANSDLIDLRPATLLNAPGGGGYVSKAAGGFAIAHGVMIENASGGDGDDTLYGNDGNNSLTGDAGNDVLWGGAGNDSLNGGDGLDRADFTFAANGIKVDLTIATSQDTGEGTDTFTSIEAVTGSRFNDQITIAPGMSADGGDGQDTLILGGKAVDYSVIYTGYHSYQLISSAGAFNINNIEFIRLDGRTFSESQFTNIALYNGVYIDDDENGHVLNGTAGKDVINGNGGNDTITGGDGDELSGGSGDDTFFITGLVSLVSGGDGFDTVSYANAAGPVSASLSGYTGIEQLKGSAYNDHLTGNPDANLIDGGTGGDVMQGGAGDDSYYVDNASDSVVEYSGEGDDTVYSSLSFSLQNAPEVEHLILTGTANLNGTGNTSVNSLVGNTGNNILDGGAGADTMTGGLGDDVYVVDAAGDVIVENAAEGTDTARSDVTYSLSANVENLVLTGSADINGTGNSADNSLTGNTGNNVLTGGDGKDILDGGLGADTLAGGLGNDTYYVDNAGDVVTEAAAAGADTVNSAVTYTLTINVENLNLMGTANLNGTGNASANTLVGTSGNNVLDGGAGADTLMGGLGDDTYVVDAAGDVVVENAAGGTDMVRSTITYTLGANIENLVLIGAAYTNGTGNALDNTLIGNAGKNILNGGDGKDSLDGGHGADTMIGGADNDTYYVDNAGDVVTELTGGGIDTVIASLTFTLGDNVEKLTLTGKGNIAGAGNAVGNVLVGNDGNNKLSGLAGNDTLSGGLGDDILDGGKGADVMKGGAGDDRYYVENSSDVITEYSGQGHDTVITTLNYALGANVEDLIQVGTHDYYASGNALDNHLTGNIGNNLFHGGDGNDVIDGGKGADKMYGGLGKDTFYVDNVGDVVVEYTNQGTDTVVSTITYALGGAVENLTLGGATNIDGTGTSGDNILIGNAGSNSLTGGKGHDTLTGGLGADTFVFGLASGADTITDFKAAQGDKINVNAYTHGTAQAAFITHVGSDTIITLSTGNVITVTGASVADVSSHMIW